MKKLAGVQLFDVTVELDNISPAVSLLVAAKTVEEAAEKAEQILTSPPQHLRVDYSSDEWATGEITKIEKAGVIDA